MKNRIKKLSLLLILFLINFNVSAQESSLRRINNMPSLNSSYRYRDYVIDSYNIDIKVNENNTYDITETIEAYFNVQKHGIFRILPLKNNISRLDGTTSKNRVKISNLNVNEPYTTSRENGNYKIKIGSASKTLTGQKIYKISYNYNIGKDPLKEVDEFYYNIIGNEWDTVIGNVTFKITMPKEFDEEKLGFSSGSYGSTENSQIEYEVDGNVITGSYNGILSSGEALTVRLTLDEGYFVGASDNYGIGIYLMYILPILFLLITFILWYKYGKDKQVIETVEFYPPEGFNSLEIGYLYRGKANNKDVVSLLIYLANKGYLKIEETEEKLLFYKSKSFKIIKLKDYDGNNEAERKFFNGLFVGRSSVKLEYLQNLFYKTINKILTIVNSKENKNQIFEKLSFVKKFAVILMIIISLITIVKVPMDLYGDTEDTITSLFLILFYTPFYAVMFSKGIPLMFRIIWSSITIVHSLAFFSTMPLIGILMEDKICLYGFLLGVLCIVGMIYLFKILPKRTDYGIQMLGKIKGFKTFLETAEKERLESLVTKNPTYFYDILPYTYVLGVSDKWIKKFEVIAINEPDWYSSPSGFTISNFGTFMNSTMKNAERTMSSSPSSSGSSGGGSSSVGGSSGGGSGGGGGGSW